MDKKNTIFITGANGEIGHGLIIKLSDSKDVRIITLDLSKLDTKLKPLIYEEFRGSVTDKNLVNKIFNKYKINTIYHLAAILSTGAEKNPELAQEVNVGGTALLLEIANRNMIKLQHKIKFIFPSTVAVYGILDIKTKQKTGAIKENGYLTPITMYGINKLYCENLGKYYSESYRLLATHNKRYIDFRCVRFPGIISASTIPTGGTSDYAPEILHAAAKGQKYKCFVRPDTTIPFMVMPDAIKALLQLVEVPKKKLRHAIYNVQGFSASAKEISKIVKFAFPESKISFNPDINRQKIVDSWPESIDDTRAKKDWGWKPNFNLERAFRDYLVPEIKKSY